MKHIVTGLVIAAAGCAASASEPGQPLDCSDWVFLEPGHSCTPVETIDCYDQQTRNLRPECASSDAIEVLNDSRRTFLRRVALPDGCAVGDQRWRTELVVRSNQINEVVAYIDDRCYLFQQPGTTRDAIEPLGRDEAYQLKFDRMSGRILILLRDSCARFDSSGECYDASYWLAAVDGFATVFDILQTFAPSANALGFRVPYMPEGMAAADNFDTYWGALTHPIDFSQAHGLSCDYPATPLAVGDYLEVVDTLPAPAVGQGYWYLTSATYQGQARVGRKTSGGRLSGRDPALLPACTAAE